MPITWVERAIEVFRDFVTDGVPSSGPFKPNKEEIRVWGTQVENYIAATLNQRSILGPGDLPLTTDDRILLVNLSAQLTITLLDSATLQGPMTFIDVAGKWGGSSIPVFNTTGGQTMSGLASGAVVGRAAYQVITFLPLQAAGLSGYVIT